MGYEDRDYHRSWWAKKQRYTEKSSLRMNLGQAKKAKRFRFHVVLALLIVIILAKQCLF